MKPGASPTYTDQSYKNTSVLQLDEIIINTAHESVTLSVIYTPACLFTLRVSDLSLAMICKIIFHVYFKYMKRKTHWLFIKHTLRLKRHVVNHLSLMLGWKSLKRLNHCGMLTHMVKLNEFKHKYNLSRSLKLTGITQKKSWYLRIKDVNIL